MKFGPMKPHRRNQLLLIGLLVSMSGIAVTLALTAFDESVNLFYDPAQIAAGEAPTDRTIRAGGMVVDGSVARSKTDLTVTFEVGDLAGASYRVQYVGILPDLFREGQGVIATGRLNAGGVFVAEEVLAKHDETYMPPEVADALEKAHAGRETGAMPAMQANAPRLPAAVVQQSEASALEGSEANL